MGHSYYVVTMMFTRLEKGLVMDLWQYSVVSIMHACYKYSPTHANIQLHVSIMHACYAFKHACSYAWFQMLCLLHPSIYQYGKRVSCIGFK